MTDGYHDSENEDFSDLDEWLCEYVDGTIDAAARHALEDYMRVNPALAHHVQRLLQAKNLLCLYGCRHQAPHSLQPRLHERLARESHGIPMHGAAFLTSRLGKVATFSAVVALLFLVGNLPPRALPDRPIRKQTTATLSPRTLRPSLPATHFTSPPSARAAAPSFASLSDVPRMYPLLPRSLFMEYPTGNGSLTPILSESTISLYEFGTAP